LFISGNIESGKDHSGDLRGKNIAQTTPKFDSFIGIAPITQEELYLNILQLSFFSLQLS